MIPDKVQNDFYAGIRTEVVKLCINDDVEVLGGKFKGMKCAVISIEQIEPEVVYLIECGDDGSSIREPQSNLRMI